MKLPTGRTAAVATMCALLTALGMAAPANAAGTEDPVILTPTGGQTVAYDFSGPVKIDFSNAAASSYDVEVYCSDSDYYWWDTVDIDGSEGVLAFSIDPMPQASDCSVEVWDYDYWYGDSSLFKVAAKPLPPLVLDNVSVTRSTFYPRVRDGYMDSTAIKYRLNHKANVTVRVKNSSGVTIRRANLGPRLGGAHRWSWNGKRRNGSVAATGRYRIQLTAVDSAKHKKSAGASSKVATGVRATRVTKAEQGYWWDRSDHSPSCYVNDYSYDNTTQLDCWGGRFAWVAYNFRLPDGARNVSWSVTGERGCCSDGRIVKAGTRSGNRVSVKVKVTGWRSYTVKRVFVTYTYDRRI